MTLAYANANVSRDGSGAVVNDKVITANAAVAAAGTDLANYAVSYVSNTASTITPYVANLVGGRVYDATTAVNASVLTLGTLVGSEGLSLSGSGVLADKNVGTGKVVGLGSLALVNGTGLASNYTLVGGSILADVTPASLAVTTSDVVKTYDGNLSVAGATVAPTPVVKAGSNTQLFGNDTLNGGSYAFTDVNAGSGNRTVTVAGVVANDGNGGANYIISYASNTTSTITPAALTVSALAQTKVYDGTMSVPSLALGTGYSVLGLVGSESLTGVTLAYANANVSRNGSGVVLNDKVITANGAVAAVGTNLANYAVSYVGNAASTITPAPLKVTLSDLSKIYDSLTSATGTPIVVADGATRLIGSATLSGGTFTFVSPDAGTNKTVQISGVTVNDGNNGGNYAIAYVPNTNSTITRRLVSLSAAKVFDGTTDLAGWVTILTGISGQTLGYTEAKSFSAEVMALDNYISQITLSDSLSAKASNYILPVLSAANAPVQIVLPLPSMLKNPTTYDKLSAPASQPVSNLTTNPVIIETSTTSANTGTSTATTSGTTAVASGTSTGGTSTATTSGTTAVASGTTSGGTSTATTSGTTAVASGTTSGGTSTTTTGSTTAVATGASADTASSGTSDASSGGASTGSIAQSAGFISVDPLDPPAIERGATFEVQIPVTAFRHTNENAQIALKVELPEGGSLPAWISFDPLRDTLSGTAPEGVSDFAVVVTATDERGGVIKATINLHFSR